jgi:hypothetical protein
MTANAATTAVIAATLLLTSGCDDQADRGLDYATRVCEDYAAVDPDEPVGPDDAMVDLAAKAAREDSRWDYLFLYIDEAKANEEEFKARGEANGEDPQLLKLAEEAVRLARRIEHECRKTSAGSR